MSGNNAQMTAYSVFNGMAPKEGPKALTFDFDLRTVGTLTDDLLLENTNGVIQFVQTAYVDNSTNPNPLTIYFPITRQKLVVPATAQGNWPVFSPDQTQFTVSTTPDPGAIGTIIFLNVPMPLTTWGPQTINANITAETITPVIAATDLSDAITAGGSSQIAIPANASRKGFVVQNPSDQIEPLYLDFGGTAAAQYTSIEILPGEMFPANGQPYIYQGDINLTAASTAHPYIAKEFA